MGEILTFIPANLKHLLKGFRVAPFQGPCCPSTPCTELGGFCELLCEDGSLLNGNSTIWGIYSVFFFVESKSKSRTRRCQSPWIFEHFLKLLGIFPWPHDHCGVLGTSEIKGSSLLRFPTLTRHSQHDLCTPNLLCPLASWGWIAG